MSLREKVTDAILSHSPIPENKQNPDKRAYFFNYNDNLFCPMSDATAKSYGGGSGGETNPTVKNVNGDIIIGPPKMASVASSSAMTFNLLGNDPVTVGEGSIMPKGNYNVEYEKQMFTVNKGSSPANLDAFLSNKSDNTAVFCEMKMLEWLGTPGLLKEAYLDENYYFTPDYDCLCCPVDAFKVFSSVIDMIKGDFTKAGYKTKYKRYDAWQMLKHLISVYNYTSFAVADSVNEFGKVKHKKDDEPDKFKSMAGIYNNIILLNVVNEFPPDLVEDTKARGKYIEALKEEQREAADFIGIIENSDIPRLFAVNCSAAIKVKYASAEQFAACIDMSSNKREYLRRYFG